MKKIGGSFLVLALSSFLLGGCDIFSLVSSSSTESSSSSSISSSSESSYIEGDYDPISFHFIEENVQNSGDVIYIKAGDNDILIDGGATKAVASTVKNYLKSYVSDEKLEYVFVTHAHEDHLAGLVGKSLGSDGLRDGLLYSYQIDNLIDFSYFMSNKITIDNSYDHELTEKESPYASVIYTDYLNARDYLVKQGTKHHIAKELTSQGNNWTLSLGKGISVTLLYQFYYDHTRSETKTLDPSYNLSGFSDQNDCSLALLFRQGEKQMLFTGDAETYAESSIAKDNPELGHVSLFKAGHHGSPTASSDALLKVITPDAVVASCVAGNREYNQTSKETTFPGQEVINRVSAYTDSFYVTTQGDYDNKSYHVPLNGDVVFSYDSKGQESRFFSASDKKLKDTEWFINNRTMPSAWKNDEEAAIWLPSKEEGMVISSNEE